LPSERGIRRRIAVVEAGARKTDALRERRFNILSSTVGVDQYREAVNESAKT
jgi:hypothetical protein